MSEVFHSLEHLFGICGEKHISFVTIFSEVYNWDIIIKYIKLKIKYYVYLGIF